MARRARVSRQPDTQRLGEMISRPGIDPRVWVSLAVALDESFVEADEGVFVKVMLLPTGEEMLARVGAAYAGKGFGLYAGIHKDDELKVELPSGDPAEGPVVTARLWSAADTPPQEVVDHPEEVLLVVEKDKNLRLITSGAGKIYVKGETVTLETQKARLGAEDATEAVILGNTYRTHEDTLNTAMAGKATADAAADAAVAALLAAMVTMPAMAAYIAALPGGPALITAAATTLAASATASTGANTAVTDFLAQAATFLSTVTKTK